ncbi:MAG: two-component system response regulator [Candidatus Pacebacteria bacterium CG10_big_fil_rev_8_21_14_0_10_42_12]|nr:MAG: two-component system response regulator [Candidatus Pacebacteria bacterium CG10_big_fil_rev_8_21_14_0_10_42_12]
MNTQAKILLADDSAFMRKVLMDILTEAGFSDFLEAENGNQALELIEKESPDLVLLDMIMPELEGIGVLSKLKELGNTTKVIVVSAVGQDAMIEEAKNLGAFGYVVKPFEGEKVLETIKSALG